MIYALFVACINQPASKTDGQYLAECYNQLYASAYAGSSHEYLLKLQRSKRKTLQHHCMTPTQATYILHLKPEAD